MPAAPAAQTCPSVRIRAFAWISFCDRTMVAGRKRSTIERMEIGTDRRRRHQNRQMAPHRLLLEDLAQPLDEAL
jgi:hypothetical protein